MWILVASPAASPTAQGGEGSVPRLRLCTQRTVANRCVPGVRRQSCPSKAGAHRPAAWMTHSCLRQANPHSQSRVSGTTSRIQPNSFDGPPAIRLPAFCRCTRGPTPQTSRDHHTGLRPHSFRQRPHARRPHAPSASLRPPSAPPRPSRLPAFPALLRLFGTPVLRTPTPPLPLESPPCLLR
jgi:hypothetical protein